MPDTYRGLHLWTLLEICVLQATAIGSDLFFVKMRQSGISEINLPIREADIYPRVFWPRAASFGLARRPLGLGRDLPIAPEP